MGDRRSAYDDYKATTRFGSLDGLRCLAIVPVFWHHCTLGPLAGVLGKGPLGVDLFFAISGFLITTLLLRERDATGRVAAGAFYARRSLRIFPLYYAVLGLYVLHAWLGMPSGPQRDHFWRSLPFFATYTTNWFVNFAVPHPVSFAFSWSLAAEEQFYLVWPWVIRLGGYWPAIAGLGLLGLDQGAEHGLWASVLAPGGLGHRIVSSIASPICMGALLALALHARRTFIVAGVLLGQRASALILLAALGLCVVFDVPLWSAHLLLAAIVGACVVRRNSLVWLLNSRAVAWVGTVSYGVYLLHVGVITFVRRSCPGLAQPAWTFIVALPLTVALASLSFRLFEQRLLALRRRFPPA